MRPPQAQTPADKGYSNPLHVPPASHGLVLVLTDLHLAAGRDPITGRYSARENFQADDAFRSLLSQHIGAEKNPLLIFGGDTFDFLRVTETPRSDEDFLGWSYMLAELHAERPEEELRRITRKERRYGFGTEDYKCVWKLLYIERGHADFFACLAEWLQRGGSITFVKGNHDVELHWPVVQAAIRRAIACWADKNPGYASEDRIQFAENSLLIENIYLEHGNRFESITRVIGGAVAGDGKSLNLPLGSFVNAYLINKLELLDPFLDNQKPVQDVVWSTVRRSPLAILRILWYGIPLLRRSFRPYWWKHSLAFIGFFLTLLIPAVLILAVILSAIPALRAWIPDFIEHNRLAFSVGGVIFPYVISAIREVFVIKRRRVTENEFSEGIYETMCEVPFPAKPARVYGVMGHTHRPDIQRLPKLRNAEAIYLNCGTWIARWDATRPDLIGRVVLGFLRFTRDEKGEFRHEQLEWVRETNSARPAVVLQPFG